jgi:hypothetical protein
MIELWQPVIRAVLEIYRLDAIPEETKALMLDWPDSLMTAQKDLDVAVAALREREQS